MLADSVLSSGKCPYTTSKVNTSSSDGPAPVCTQLMLTPTTPRSGPNGCKIHLRSREDVVASEHGCRVRRSHVPARMQVDRSNCNITRPSLGINVIL